MVKQLTALILVLALANPFCCCFAKPVSDEGSTPSHSCCHSQPVESDSSEQPSDDQGPESCPCEKPMVQAGESGFEKLPPIASSFLKIQHSYSESLHVFQEPKPFCSGFAWRPPPSDTPLYRMHCVFRM